MKLLSVFLLLGVCEGEGGAQGSSTFVVAAYEDLYLSGGAGVQAAPLLSLRSGNPNGRSAAAVRQPLLPGVVVDRVTFAYRYDTGYGPTGVGSNFSLRVAGQQVYASPHLTDYEYSQNRSNYSSPVQVDASALGIGRLVLFYGRHLEAKAASAESGCSRIEALRLLVIELDQTWQ